MSKKRVKVRKVIPPDKLRPGGAHRDRAKYHRPTDKSREFLTEPPDKQNN